MGEVGERAGEAAQDDRPGPGRPRPRPVGPVNRLRVVGGTVGIIVFAAVVMELVGRLPAGRGAGVAAFAVGLALAPVMASPIEWFGHRYVYHEEVWRPLGAIFVVHNAHHHAFFPPWRYLTYGPARRLALRRRTDIHMTPLRNAGVRLTHWSGFMATGAVLIWLPAWLVTRDGAFLAGLVLSSAVVSNLFVVVHDVVHRPGSHRIVEMQPWYPFLDRHHYIHHVDLGANLNFLLPLSDLLFGTLRTALSADELAGHGSLEAAKAKRIGQGERARLVVG